MDRCSGRAQSRHPRGVAHADALITSGPYRLGRHPIYTSMLGILLATGSLITPWWLFLPSLILFIIGTEIRVRIEDHLLASQFGDRFAEYQKRVPAYIPFPK